MRANHLVFSVILLLGIFFDIFAIPSVVEEEHSYEETAPLRKGTRMLQGLKKSKMRMRGMGKLAPRDRSGDSQDAQGPVAAKDAADAGGAIGMQRVSVEGKESLVKFSPQPMEKTNGPLKPKPQPKGQPGKQLRSGALGDSLIGPGVDGKPRSKLTPKDRPLDVKLGPKLKPKPVPVQV